MAKLRRCPEGNEFLIPRRPNSHKDVRKKNYPMASMMRDDLPAWAKKCLHILVKQIDDRFLKRKMNKWIYIATVMDPRNKLDKCFRPGDAVSVDDATKMYVTELTDIARCHDIKTLETPNVIPPPAACMCQWW
jgi:hypothetical protein